MMTVLDRAPCRLGPPADHGRMARVGRGRTGWSEAGNADKRTLPTQQAASGPLPHRLLQKLIPDGEVNVEKLKHCLLIKHTRYGTF